MTVSDAGPNPALRVVLSLPTCEGDSDLGTWMLSALAPYPELPLLAVDPMPVADAIRDVPILRDLCAPGRVTAARMGNAVGWEARDPSRRLLARAAGVGTPGHGVPGRMVAHAHSYHQECGRNGTWRKLSWLAAYPLGMRVRCDAVPAWNAIEQAEPEFAGRVRRLFDAGRHKTIATLRADGSPRISGIECEFADGDLRFGSMTNARKGADLKRDPRFALHGPTFHPEEGKESDWPGEAKIAGRAVPAGPVTTNEASEQPDGEIFVGDITEVVVTGLNPEATKLVVESWTPERGLRRVERD